MRQPQQTLKLRDLVYSILKAWRRLILFALIGALLMGAFAVTRGGSGSKTADPLKELTAKEIETITKAVLSENPEAVKGNKHAETLIQRMADIGQALAKSPYLAIDGRAQVLLSFKVKFIPQEPGITAEETYEDRLYLLSLSGWKSSQSEAFFHYLSREIDGLVDPDWLPELVSSELGADRLITVQLTAAEEDLAQTLALAAQSFFKSEILQYMDIDFPFEMTVTSLDRQVVENPAIEAKRHQLEKELFEAADLLEEEKARIALFVEEALNAAREGEMSQDDAPAEEGSGRSRRNLVKYILVGAFLGVFLAAILAILKTLSSGMVFNPEDLAGRLELFYIGSAMSSSGLAARSFGGGIDRWLEGLFYGRRKDQAKHSSPDYLASLISRIDLPGPPHEGKREEDRPARIAVMGLAGDQVALELTQALEKQISGQGDGSKGHQKARLAELGSTQGLEALKESDAAVLHIPARKIGLAEVLRQLDLASATGRKILGVVSSDI